MPILTATILGSVMMGSWTDLSLMRLRRFSLVMVGEKKGLTACGLELHGSVAPKSAQIQKTCSDESMPKNSAAE